MKKLALVMSSLLTVLAVLAAADDATGYEYFITGNPNDTTTNTSYGLLLMGGGKDVASAFQWMMEKSGGMLSSSIGTIY